MFETPRLVIRNFRYGDEDSFYKNVQSDPFVYLYLEDTMKNTVDETREYIASRMPYYAREDFYDFAIEDKETGEVIGEINAARKGNACDIGYCLGSSYWNRGLMSEAVKYFVDDLREKGVREFYAACRYENPASMHVLMRAGFVRVKEIPSVFYKMENEECLFFALRNDN